MSSTGYSLAFAAKVVVGKYLDHVPLERHSRILALSGCWGHVRRAFADVERDFPEARIALDHIRPRYDARCAGPERGAP